MKRENILDFRFRILDFVLSVFDQKIKDEKVSFNINEGRKIRPTGGLL